MTALLSKLFSARTMERTGIALVVVSVLILFLTFFPVIKEEIKYQFLPRHDDALVLTSSEAQKTGATGIQEKSEAIVPVDEDFGIVIPKIGANAVVIADVDWQDAAVYQQALTKGIAQARGTARPGEFGNIFLFSHSGVDFFEANRYNALFYLINKLQLGDEIILLYQKEKYTYKVTEKKTVAPESLEYLAGDATKKTLTLMTCWPAGTTLKRLIVIADQVSP